MTGGNEAVMSVGRRVRGVFEDRRQVVCLAVAVALVIGGTLGTGLLPATLVGQTAAGAAIVAGFGLGFYCLGALELAQKG